MGAFLLGGDMAALGLHSPTWLLRWARWALVEVCVGITMRAEGAVDREVSWRWREL